MRKPILAVSVGAALGARLKAEGLHMFHVKTPVEFGMIQADD